MERTQTKLTPEVLNQYSWECPEHLPNVANRPTYYHPLYRIRLVQTKEGDKYTAFDSKQSRFTGHTFHTIEKLLYHLNAADKTLVRPDRLEEAGWTKNEEGNPSTAMYQPTAATATPIFLQEGRPSEGDKDTWLFCTPGKIKPFKTMEELQLLLLEV